MRTCSILDARMPAEGVAEAALHWSGVPPGMTILVPIDARHSVEFVGWGRYAASTLSALDAALAVQRGRRAFDGRGPS